MENLNASIREAFFRHDCFLTYYNALNTFFDPDKIGLISTAKTISVAIRSAHLHDTYGYSYPVIYECFKEIFGGSSSLKLSSLINLSDYDAFRKSVSNIISEYYARREDVLQVSKSLNKMVGRVYDII